MRWRSRSRTRRIEDDARTSPDVKLSGRQLTAQQKDERRQGNGDKKQLACQHLSDLLGSLTREQDRQKTARHHFDSAWASPFRLIKLSMCSVWGTWCTCVYSGTSENGLPLLQKPPQCGQQSAVPNYSLYYSICTKEISVLRTPPK